MDDKDSFDYDDDLGAMSILSGADARRKSFESESGKSARKNKVFQHIKKEMDLRAKVKTVVNPAEQVSSFEKPLVGSTTLSRFTLLTNKEMLL